VPVTVKAAGNGTSWRVFQEHRDLISLLIGSQEMQITREAVDRRGSIPVVGSGFEAFVYVRQSIDLEKETGKLKKELRSLEEALKRTEAKLENKSFLSKAPEEVVKKESDKQELLRRRKEKIAGYIADLGKDQ
jgi:valyl-tRNA synthetase